MNDSLLVATLAGLGGMLGWGLADFVAKKTIDSVGEVTTLFWAQAGGVLPLLAVLAFTRHMPAMHNIDALWLLLLGVVSALFDLSLYTGFAKGSLSFLSPVFSSHAILVVILSAAVFGERISSGQWVAIVVVLGGVLAISTTLKDLRSSNTRGLPNVLFAAVAFAFWLVFLDKFLGARDWVFFLIVIRLVAAATVGVYAGIKGEPLSIPRRNADTAAYVGLVGVFDTAAFASVAYGFSATTHTSIVAVLSSVCSVPALILARVFLRERLAPHQKVAAGVIFCGIALVSIH